jgi:P-type E1-E2 ATPase
MFSIQIPGWKNLQLARIAFDYNGTLALDGKISPSARKKLIQLAQQVEVYILTSDTFGSVREECNDLPVTINVLETGYHTEEKAAFVAKLGAEHTAAVGNGANDRLMLQTADLGILVMGPEGYSPLALAQADIALKNIEDVFELFFSPQRLIATLRR